MEFLNTLSIAILLYTAIYYIPHGLINALGYRKKFDPLIDPVFHKKLITLGIIQIFLVFLSIFPGVFLIDYPLYLALFSSLLFVVFLHIHRLQFKQSTSFLSGIVKTFKSLFSIFIDNAFYFRILMIIILLGPLLLSYSLSFTHSVLHSFQFMSLFIFLAMLPCSLLFGQYLEHIESEKTIF